MKFRLYGVIPFYDVTAIGAEQIKRNSTPTKLSQSWINIAVKVYVGVAIRAKDGANVW